MEGTKEIMDGRNEGRKNHTTVIQFNFIGYYKYMHIIHSVVIIWCLILESMFLHYKK